MERHSLESVGRDTDYPSVSLFFTEVSKLSMKSTLKSTMDNSFQKNSKQRMLGVWDLRASAITLGGLLLFVEELLIAARRQFLPEVCDIAIVQNKSRETGNGVAALTRENCEEYPVLSVLFDLAGIGRIFLIETGVLSKFVEDNGYDLWPTKSVKPGYRYGTTLFAQEFFKEHGFVPQLSCSLQARKRAGDFYRKHIAPNLPVVMHLKNNPRHQGQSNANLPAWFEFFAHRSSRDKVKFILIGNEDPGEEIRGLANVVLTQDDRDDLGRDLALIEMAFLFMGMASGPCNLAIFSNVPYMIFKNPDHHTQEMKRELRGQDHFVFARPLQKMLRVVETGAGLIKEWEHFLTHLSPQDWQVRLEQIDHKKVEFL